MPTAVQFRRGSTIDHGSFTGLVGEVTVDTDKNTLIVHDGSTAGGFELAKSAETISPAGGTFTGDVEGTNLTLTGYLRGPSNFVIDPAAHGDDTGTLVIAGNLQVDGTTTTVNSTTLDVSDLNITVASGAADAASANGAGLTIDGANITVAYDHSNTRLSISSDTHTTGSLFIDQTLNVAGNSLFTGNIDTGGTLGVTGNATFFGNASVSGDLDVTGNATMLGNIDVTGDILQNGSPLDYASTGKAIAMAIVFGG